MHASTMRRGRLRARRRSLVPLLDSSWVSKQQGYSNDPTGTSIDSSRLAAPARSLSAVSVLLFLFLSVIWRPPHFSFWSPPVVGPNSVSTYLATPPRTVISARLVSAAPSIVGSPVYPSAGRESHHFWQSKTHPFMRGSTKWTGRSSQSPSKWRRWQRA